MTRISLRLETSVTFPLHVLHVLLWEPMACHGKNGPPKIGSPRNLFYCKIWTPTEKFGPPHIDEKNIDPEHIWTSGLSRRVSEVLETIQARKFSSTQLYKPHSQRNRTLHSIPCTLRNYFCERCVRPTEAY